MVREIITTVLDDGQGLEREIEEVFRLGKYKEGGKRPQKVRMRSKLATEEDWETIGNRKIQCLDEV